MRDAAAGVDEALDAVDLVVTGEGRIDAGSFDGKVVGGVVSRAGRRGVPVIAIGGVADPGLMRAHWQLAS